jgi:hypothetical protein
MVDAGLPLTVSPLTLGRSLRLERGAVTVDADGLAWSERGVARRMRHDQICEIRLTFSMIGRIPTAACRVTFRNGTWLAVVGTAPSGLSDDAAAASYRRFVPEFHRRIPQALRAGIAFRRGVAAWRIAVAKTLLVILGGSLAVVVVVLAIANLREQRAPWLELLGMTATVAGLGWAGMRWMADAAPGGYDPDAIPPELLR